MKYAIIGRTDGYHANRNYFFHGVTERILQVFDTMKEANTELLKDLNQDYDKNFTNWGLAKSAGYGQKHMDGSASYCYDGYGWETKEIEEIPDFADYDYERLSMYKYNQLLDQLL